MKTSLILVLLLTPLSLVFADYVDPTAKTNVNVQSDLFKKSVGDVEGLQALLEADKQKSLRGLNDPKNTEILSGKSKSEVESSASSLSSIKPLELGSKGREAASSNPEIQDLFVDETKPGFAAYARDAKLIAEASGDLVGRLTDKLRELGVDCRAVKGNKEVEPDYRIEVAREKLPRGDTVYNKQLCEDLRNNYSCTDSLKLTCKSTRMKWNQGESRYIDLSGHDIYWYHNNWIYSRKLYRRHFRFFIYQDSGTMGHIRSFIAGQLGVNLEQITDVTAASSDGWGRILNMTEKGRVWEFYRIYYRYRTGDLECSEWGEDWTENCRLQ